MRAVATVSALRAGLARYLKQLADGPVTVLSHGKPVAILVEPDFFYAMVDKCTLLESLQDGLLDMVKTIENQDGPLDIKQLLDHLGR